MSKGKETITGGLGLREEFFKKAQELVLDKLRNYDTISDALESTAEVLRDEELGESNLRVSDYEKKLILSGFVMGTIRAEAEMSKKLEELKLLMHLMSMSKKVGTDEKGDPILGGAVKLSDVPEELRDVLARLAGRSKKEEEDGDDD